MPRPLNAFIGQTTQPSDTDLGAALGPAKPVWDRLVADLATDGVTGLEWRSYSPKAGWALKLKRGKRTIVWLAPLAGSFEVLFLLGDRAVAAAREVELPARILKALDKAARYPEGTGLRLRMRTARDIPVIRRLAAIKLQH